MSNDSLYIQVQPEMIQIFKKELAEGSDVYAIYAKYKNLSVREEYGNGDIEVITRCQFICDLAKHMITEKAMLKAGYCKSEPLGLWEKKTD